MSPTPHTLKEAVTADDFDEDAAVNEADAVIADSADADNADSADAFDNWIADAGFIDFLSFKLNYGMCAEAVDARAGDAVDRG